MKILFLIPMALTLQGCFWGFFGGSIKVENETKSDIVASLSQNNLGNGYYYPENQGIDPGDYAYFPLHSLTFSPKVYVKYQGIKREYSTSLDFFGFDTVYVNEEDFIPKSNG